tara:strand:+ start:1588 stop:2292 length:705 start_codon:yes stop_codon:yes gene_type:complete
MSEVTIKDFVEGTYRHLIKGLNNIANRQHSKYKYEAFIYVLLEAELNAYEKYNKNSDKCLTYNQIVMKYDIQPVNMTHTHSFNCICTKQNLMNLCIVHYDTNNYIIGSCCIKRLEKAEELKIICEDLYNKMLEWGKQVNKMLNPSIDCVNCGEPGLTRDTLKQYMTSDKTKWDTDTRLHAWCKNCIVGNSVICPGCKKLFYKPARSYVYNSVESLTKHVYCKDCYDKYILSLCS